MQIFQQIYKIVLSPNCSEPTNQDLENQLQMPDSVIQMQVCFSPKKNIHPSEVTENKIQNTVTFLQDHPAYHCCFQNGLSFKEENSEQKFLPHCVLSSYKF